MKEALTLALEALENISTALREDDVLGSDSELMLNAITAIKEALAHDDEDAIIIQYHESTIKWLEKRIEELTAQPKRPWVGLTEIDILAASKHWRHAEDFMAGVYWAAGTLKEKNT